MIQKDFYFRVYDEQGNNKGTLSSKLFSSVPVFSMEINGGLTELSMKTTYSFDDYLKNGKTFERLEVGDRIYLFVVDKESSGRQVYSGIYAGERVSVSADAQTITIRILPNSILLSKRVARNSAGETTLNYLSVDPADMVREIVYVADTDIRYTEQTLYNTDVARTYSFRGTTCLDALREIVNLLPQGFYFYIGADNLVYLKNYELGTFPYTKWGAFNWNEANWYYDAGQNLSITHYISFDNGLYSLDYEKDFSDLTNRVILLGGGGPPALYTQMWDSDSITQYGVFEEVVADERITTEETAVARSNRILETKAQPTVAVLGATIIDSNTAGNGFDIESLNVGDKMLFTAQGEFLNEAFYIQRINYNFTEATVELQDQPIAINQRIEDINRDLRKFRFGDAPDVPMDI